jgi:glycine/D-amino acid oxidase-like deaminating enzyme
MRAIVIGGGIMGLSVAWALARVGHEVELFEQGPLPNPLAASMDEHRLIRHPYGDYRNYARMIDDAHLAWDMLWRDLGRRFYAATGTLALAGRGNDWAHRSAATLAGIGRPMTVLAADELTRRFPMIIAGDVETAYWIDSGGVLFAQDIAESLAQYLAAKANVQLRAGITIRSVDLERGRVVTTEGTVHTADVVIVAAGAWIGRLLPAFDMRLVPSRQIVVYFKLPPAARSAWSQGPMVLDLSGNVGLYLVPPIQGRGMKVGDHEFSRVGDPDASRQARQEEMQSLLDRCRSLLSGFDDWRIDRLKVCFYTVTEDERFVVEKHGAKGWLMSACSGHGFKFGALMGLELASTIASERDPLQHARWAAGLGGD